MAKSNFLNRIRKSSKYRKAKVGPVTKSDKSKRKRKLPEIDGNPFLVIGIDQAVVNIGFGILYCDLKNNIIEPMAVAGSYRERSDILTNLIIINSKHRMGVWPEFQEARKELIDKITIMKMLILKRLFELKYNEKIKKVFVVIESIHYGKYENIVKELVRSQTIVAEQMLQFFDWPTEIYEYTPAEAKSAVSVGVKKDAVTDSVNHIFETDMPTYKDFMDKIVNETQYKKFTHISDAIALAYALLKDLMAHTISNDLFGDYNA